MRAHTKHNTSADGAAAGIQARYVPPATPAPHGGGEGGVDAGTAAAAGVVELLIMSEQRWVLPTLLLLVRLVFGDALTVRVSTTLRIDPRSGKVISQVKETGEGCTIAPRPAPARFVQ